MSDEIAEEPKRAEVHWCYTVYGANMDTEPGRVRYEQDVSAVYLAAGTDIIESKRLLAQVSISLVSLGANAVLFQLIIQAVDADLVEKQRRMNQLSGPRRAS